MMFELPDNLSSNAKLELLELLEEKKRRERYRSIFKYYPDTGPLRRELYPKHIEFLNASAKHREKACLSGNRTGKTEGLGGFETVLHMIGEYPSWWEGKRFDHPISAWAAGKTNITVRDILQKKLCGPVEALGTGLIPGELIVGKPSRKAGVPDAYETIRVKHKSGGISDLSFKSYESGRDGFEGTEKHLIWLDEEPPVPVYTECLIRTMKTGFFQGGIVICTFTPMEGMSETCMFFLENGAIPEDGVVTETGRYVKMLSWHDAPHLSEEEKAEMLKAIPEYQRKARTTGIPALGSGAIYPIAEENIIVDPFPIPPFWPKCYALDVGWSRTAALWAAWDRESDVVYLYSEHYMGEEKPTVHASAIKSRGTWIPGVIDPAARGRSQEDGKQLYQLYLAEGLNLSPAINAVEAGIYEVWGRLSTGRLKVFRGLNNFMSEFRLYRRDDKGKIVKKFDHLQDCCRYACASGLQVARTDPHGNYDDFLGKLEASGDGYRRGINALLNGKDGHTLAETYH